MYRNISKKISRYKIYYQTPRNLYNIYKYKMIKTKDIKKTNCWNCQEDERNFRR